jgi:WS/DGAT/MGAT family acyltransferase
MNRLSALDAAFLYTETPETPMHVAGLAMFAKPADGLDVFAAFRSHTAERLSALPSYMRRPVSTPLGLDHPTWVGVNAIELDHHVRHLALPRPGNMAQLRELVARLHAAPLDRSRPLWEYYLIEGLESGGFAVYAKLHHSSMDGLAAMTTLPVIYDFSPAGQPTQNTAPVPAPSEPNDFIELTSTAVADLLRQGVRAARSLPKVARMLAKNAPTLAKDARYLLSYARDIPRTPFNTTISSERVYATCSLRLHEAKELAHSLGGTINDVVMAVCAGALRRYLKERGALPEAPLAAAMPVSLRPPGDAKINNQVVFTFSRLPTHVALPLPRFAAARAASAEAKTFFADLRDFMTTDISILGAPLVFSAAARLMAATRAADRIPSWVNVIISNVPGPRNSMYCAGAPADHYFPVSVPYHGCALNITVHSYLDWLDFGLIACRRSVPEAQFIADSIADDFLALRAAAEALARPDAIRVIDIARSPDLSKEPVETTGERTPPRRRRAHAPTRQARRQSDKQDGVGERNR